MFANGWLSTYEFDVVILEDESGGYVAFVPALPGCHTQGDTLQELMDKEALPGNLDVKVTDCPKMRAQDLTTMPTQYLADGNSFKHRFKILT